MNVLCKEEMEKQRRVGSQGRLNAVISGDNLSTTAVLQGVVGAWVWEPTSTYQEKADNIGY